MYNDREAMIVGIFFSSLFRRRSAETSIYTNYMDTTMHGNPTSISPTTSFTVLPQCFILLSTSEVRLGFGSGAAFSVSLMVAVAW